MMTSESPHKQFAGLDQTFAGVSGHVKRDLQDVMNSGNYYVTPEICREMKHITSGINHIHLDHEFLKSSREWGNKWSTDSVNRDKQGAIQAMQHAAQTMNHTKGEMAAQIIGTMQQNQVRQSHQNTMSNLRGVETNMGPYAHQSTDRIRQFCNHIGVTDRYTGYRNNLNRGNRDPVRLGYSWLDNKEQNPYNRSLNVGWRPGTTVPTRQSYSGRDTRTIMSAPAVSQSMENGHQSASSKSIQEQCGINTRFPGRTEYMDRYLQPPQNQPTPDYIVNPIPDFTVGGRDLGQPILKPSRTEYQTRYQFPDGSTLVRLPWLRK